MVHGRRIVTISRRVDGLKFQSLQRREACIEKRAQQYGLLFFRVQMADERSYTASVREDEGKEVGARVPWAEYLEVEQTVARPLEAEGDPGVVLGRGDRDVSPEQRRVDDESAPAAADKHEICDTPDVADLRPCGAIFELCQGDEDVYE